MDTCDAIYGHMRCYIWTHAMCPYRGLDMHYGHMRCVRTGFDM